MNEFLCEEVLVQFKRLAVKFNLLLLDYLKEEMNFQNIFLLKEAGCRFPIQQLILENIPLSVFP